MDIDRTSKSCVRIREGAVPGIFPAISDTKDRHSSKRKRQSESISELINHGESPTKKLVKVNLNKTQSDLKMYKKKVHNLQQYRRRAKRKLARLSDIIDALRTKINLQDESCTLHNSISKTSHCLIKRSMAKVVSSE